MKTQGYGGIIRKGKARVKRKRSTINYPWIIDNSKAPPTIKFPKYPHSPRKIFRLVVIHIGGLFGTDCTQSQFFNKVMELLWRAEKNFKSD